MRTFSLNSIFHFAKHIVRLADTAHSMMQQLPLPLLPRSNIRFQDLVPLSASKKPGSFSVVQQWVTVLLTPSLLRPHVIDCLVHGQLKKTRDERFFLLLCFALCYSSLSKIWNCLCSFFSPVSLSSCLSCSLSVSCFHFRSSLSHVSWTWAEDYSAYFLGATSQHQSACQSINFSIISCHSLKISFCSFLSQSFFFFLTFFILKVCSHWGCDFFVTDFVKIAFQFHLNFPFLLLSAFILLIFSPLLSVAVWHLDAYSTVALSSWTSCPSAGCDCQPPGLQTGQRFAMGQVSAVSWSWLMRQI